MADFPAAPRRHGSASWFFDDSTASVRGRTEPASVLAYFCAVRVVAIATLSLENRKKVSP